MLVVVAAGFLVWSVVDFTGAGNDLDAANAQLADAEARLDEQNAGDDAFNTTRTDALEFALHAIEVMNTLDYRTIDEDLAAWADVSTGALHDEVVGVDAGLRESILESESVSTAEVLASALRELDDRAGTAVVLAAVRIDVTLADQPPTQKWQRLETRLVRTESGWRMAEIGQVPVE